MPKDKNPVFNPIPKHDSSDYTVNDYEQTANRSGRIITNHITATIPSFCQNKQLKQTRIKVGWKRWGFVLKTEADAFICWRIKDSDV